MTKIAIVSGILHPRHGGPSYVVRSHAEALAKRSSVQIFGVAAPDEFTDIQAVLPAAHIFPAGFPKRWFRGVGLAQALSSASENVDVFHAHMLWDHAVLAAYSAAHAAGKPLIITPHGSLAAQWRSSALHKRMYGRLIIDKMLRDTAYIHALNQSEAKACSEYGISCPIQVIPNGLPLAAFNSVTGPELAIERWPQLSQRRVLLYMGRLWSEKGLDILPEAFAHARQHSRNNDWILVLAGPDYRDYKAQLCARLATLNITDCTLLTGFVGGDLKQSLLSAAECFVLPSHGEAQSIALIEAMAAGLPSVYSSACFLPELAAGGGGWELPAEQGALSQQLKQLFKMNPAALRAMGRAANRFGQANHTMEQVAAQLLKMYCAAMRR